MFAATRNVAQKYGSKIALAPVALMAAVGAHAQATDPFTDAVTAMTTKVTAYGGALVAFAAVSVGFMIAIKYVKKIPRSA